jgi:predicted kinase
MANNARLYIVCGIPFAGKSTLARELVRQRGCRALDIDALNTARGIGIAGAPISPDEWATSFATAHAQLAAALAAGEVVAYDGHCFARAERDRLRAIAHAAGAAVTLIYVDIPEALARERWRANRHTPQRHDISDDLFAQAVGLMETPDATEGALRYDGTAPVAAWVAALP